MQVAAMTSLQPVSKILLQWWGTCFWPGSALRSEQGMTRCDIINDSETKTQKHNLRSSAEVTRKSFKPQHSQALKTQFTHFQIMMVWLKEPNNPKQPPVNTGMRTITCTKVERVVLEFPPPNQIPEGALFFFFFFLTNGGHTWLYNHQSQPWIYLRHHFLFQKQADFPIQ